MQNDHYFMTRCTELAKIAASKGNAAVGSVVVKDNLIIAEAEEATKTKNDITCHAETEAIRVSVNKLGTNDLSECTLFSTHEPCIMCAYVIRFHRIKKVVYKHAGKYLGGITSSMPLLVSEDVPPYWAGPPTIVQLNNKDE
jgi:tRNA(adenine34) deaminase